MIAVSIVSHGHGKMVERLVAQLRNYPEVKQIILTLNIPEKLPCLADDLVKVVSNPDPRGFGANHNAAFYHCSQSFFCPLNPDIELPENPFPMLLQSCDCVDAALVVPLVISPDGATEDSLRRFPTICSLAHKILGGSAGRYNTVLYGPNFYPEWAAGMFMLFRCKDFSRLGGFDENFFLYYEDVDICVRTWKAGLKILACPSVSVIHHAHRESHRNLRYMRWHATSLVRYFLKHWGRLPRVNAVLKSTLQNSIFTHKQRADSSTGASAPSRKLL